mmetsp:Transcript_97956/g.297382  ORF Transcript_97956/g.297382 Transcript_97956/m.297382 type:complete len:223 (+) Transcript_97956:81-749(+)
MGLLTPAPSVLGACSLTAAVELVCAVHLAICVGIISSVSSEHSVVSAGVEISPVFQCITAAWCLLGIPLIIHGGVGAVYYVEAHLFYYLLYLAGTLAWAVAWVAVFVRFGNTCSTLQPTNGAKSEASFVCGVSNGLVIFWMLALIGAVVGSMYLVWSMKEYAKRRTETELIRYQEPWQMVQSLADEAAAEEAKVMAASIGQAQGYGHAPGYGGAYGGAYGGG